MFISRVDNKNNIKLFIEFGTQSYENVPMYRCVYCRKPVSIDDSYSCRGKILVCFSCYKSEFAGSYNKLLEESERFV